MQEKAQVGEPHREDEDSPGDDPREVEDPARVEERAQGVDGHLVEARRLVHRQPDEDQHEQAPVPRVGRAGQVLGPRDDAEQDRREQQRHGRIPGGNIALGVQVELTHEAQQDVVSEDVPGKLARHAQKRQRDNHEQKAAGHFPG